MNFDNHKPIYIQIIEIIKKELITGKKKPGDKLDSVREFALSLKVNPNTVQKAYQEMERMGLAYTQRGIGRFIVEDDNMINDLKKEMSEKVVTEFINKMFAMNYDKETIMTIIEHALGGKS